MPILMEPATDLTVTVDDDRRTSYREPGDSEKFAHYADKDAITSAYIEGTPVQAICGKVWVPTRDPKKFPVCPECQRLFDLGPQGRLKEMQESSSD